MKRTFVLDTPQRVAPFAEWIAKQDFPLSVTVGPPEVKRSTEQNARLWKLHTLASDVTGYSAEEMHEHALCRVYGYTERQVKDPFSLEWVTKREPNTRSSGRTKAEFSYFMEQVEMWYASEFGVWIEQRNLPG